MSSPSAREWSVQYDALKRRIHSSRVNSNFFPPDEIAYINNTMNNLEAQLKAMTAAPMQYEISASELARRQVVLENLKKFTMRGSSGSSSGGSLNPMLGGGAGGAAPKNDYNNVTTSDKGLAQRQQQVMKLQDEMLLDIESGVDRLHQQALQIGDEAKAHVRLLDDLDSNVDIATAALQAEAKHAQVIKDKAQMCWMYICVAVEVIILFLLIVLVLTH